jgi:cytochrome c-type biogenesis protein CcmF
LIPELGHFSLMLACVFAAAQFVLPLWGAHRGSVCLMRSASVLALGQMVALMVSFGCLVWSAVVDDFSVANIAENSAVLKPLLYKITGVWSNHEGSILLWSLILALYGGAMARVSKRLPSTLRARVIGVLGGISCGFILFALMTSNPFLRIWPAPLDGHGMNPLLQDPGLAIHPPLLYAGYVGFAVPFAFAVAALLEGRIDAMWGRCVRSWTLVAWSLLTSGIALGSWWAYYELGWGGYWFWDPVENASLMPWLTGTALLHSAIMVEKRDTMKVWTVLLAIATFSLSLSGTFLVRSGILNSVHAFASDPTRGVFILGLLGLVIGGSLSLFAWRATTLSLGGLFAPVSREGALVLNNILLCSICAVVITGTMYPPFADLLFGLKISVGKPFFDSAVLPLTIPLFAIMSIGPLLSWKHAALRPVLMRLWKAALISLMVGGLAVWGTHQFLPSLAFAGAVWLVAGSVGMITKRIQLGQLPLRESWARLRQLRAATFSAAIAHAGMGITVAGIAGMSLASHQIVMLHPGEVARVAGYDWQLLGITSEPGPNYQARIATLWVSQQGHPVAVMHPSRRLFNDSASSAFHTSGQTVQNTAISTNLLRDLYAVMGDERDGGVVLRLHVNPLAPWIWLGGLVMTLGGLIPLYGRRQRISSKQAMAVAC